MSNLELIKDSNPEEMPRSRQILFLKSLIDPVCSKLRASAMRLAILFVLITLLLNMSDAATKGYAFGTSDLISDNSDFRATKTLLNNVVDSPDLSSSSNSLYTTRYNLNRSGVYELVQGIDSWVDNYWGFRGMNTYHNFYSLQDDKSVNLSSKGNTTTDFYKYRYVPGVITETIANTTSNGHTGDYDAISKTLSDGAIFNPSINFTTQGNVSTEFLQNCSGTFKLNQGITTSPNSYWGIYGRSGFYSSFYKELEGKKGFFNSQHSTFTGSHVANAKMFSYGNVEAAFPNMKYPDKSDAAVLETNVTSTWSNDVPVDLFRQDIQLNFRTADDQMAYSGFDVNREVAIGDVDCVSEMELSYKDA